MTIFLIFLLFAVILYIFALFLMYFAFYDTNFNYNIEPFLDKKIKFSYIQINKTQLYKTLKITLKNENKIYSCEVVNKNKEALLSFAKLVDKFTRENKNKYRAKEGIILIDTISKLAVTKLIVTQKPVLMKSLKHECLRFKINKKELCVLKVLITKYLLCVLIKNYLFSSRFNKTIKQFSKNKKYNHSFKSKMASYAILKYNKKASMFDGLDTNIYPILNRLCYMKTINTLAILYLKALYN